MRQREELDGCWEWVDRGRCWEVGDRVSFVYNGYFFFLFVWIEVSIRIKRVYFLMLVLIVMTDLEFFSWLWLKLIKMLIFKIYNVEGSRKEIIWRTIQKNYLERGIKLIKLNSIQNLFLDSITNFSLLSSKAFPISLYPFTIILQIFSNTKAPISSFSSKKFTKPIHHPSLNLHPHLTWEPKSLIARAYTYPHRARPTGPIADADGTN